MSMKCAVVVGVRGDNDRLREWCLHYINLGFDKIILYDNNPKGGENPLDVVYDLKQFITYVDKRGDETKGKQMKYYSEALFLFKDQFDWIAFFDSDEYLVLNKDLLIKEYLSRDMFKDVDCIHVNWKMYNSGDRLFEDPDLSTFENYPTPMPLDFHYGYKFPENNHIKSIVHSSHCRDKTVIFNHPHYCMTWSGQTLTAVTASGHPCPNMYPWVAYDYEYAELRHYQLRTVDKFCFKRLGGRGMIMFDGAIYDPKKEIDRFFAYNKKTPEREQYIKNIKRLVCKI